MGTRDVAYELPAYLATLTPKDWKPLFALIPQIRAKKGFGKWKCPKKEDGVIVMPYCEPGSTELEFLEVVYRLRLVIDFKWADWGQERQDWEKESG